MKKAYFVLFAAICAAFTGCDADPESAVPQEQEFSVSASDCAVTPDEAAAFAREGYRLLYGHAGPQVGEVISLNVSDKVVVETDADAAAVYAVRFMGNSGYALVAADHLVGPLLAVTDRGDFSSDSEAMRWLIGRAIRLNEDAKQAVRPSLSVRVPVDGGFEWAGNLVEEVSPCISTRWGEGSPYNFLCTTSDGRQARAGSIAVAVAQCCAYYRFPERIKDTVFNWDRILRHVSSDPEYGGSYAPANGQIAYLVSQVGLLLGNVYGVNETVSTQAYLQSCFQSLGYKIKGSLDVFDWDKTYAQLKNSSPRPVIMVGYDGTKNHGWIADGYRIYEKKETIPSFGGGSLTIDRRYNYLHINFGMDGLNDGYYRAEIFGGATAAASDGVPGQYTDRVYALTGFCPEMQMIFPPIVTPPIVSEPYEPIL